VVESNIPIALSGVAFHTRRDEMVRPLEVSDQLVHQGGDHRETKKKGKGSHHGCSIETEQGGKKEK